MGDQVYLHVGESTDITLPGLGTVGYTWSPDVDDPTIVRVDRLQTEEHLGPPGKSLSERFGVVGLREGVTTITFRLARAFEPQKPPREVRTFNILVR
jgi:hypothetical protein